MKYPKRAKQHISESASLNLFNLVIPDNWIARELTEKDYGIDCYLEIVNDDNDITGELTLIQLKSKLNGVPWTKQDYYTLTGIKISTTNYWDNLAVPVFIFLTDIINRKVFFKSVDKEIRINYQSYLKQEKFNYQINKSDEFTIQDFKFQYFKEKQRKQFENELVFFLSNLEKYSDFQSEHRNRDFHMGIEPEDLIYFESMHRNYSFLCSYMNIPNSISTLSQLKNKSRERFKDGYYELYELDIAECVEDYEKQTKSITEELIKLINEESSFWISSNLTVLNFINNID
ncbi:DUF4365 domain-containing protein [Aquimarina algiphila]|uniref:DUF4365 domain-containing protein n=1 Tax=Aquimarina algiphila TaxID=2047982 RepID=UPI00232CEDEC|nr:DUF4365 domain-containing protein [Aquimarina algiphila]